MDPRGQVRVIAGGVNVNRHGGAILHQSCINPDALMSIQNGQPLMLAALTHTRWRSSGAMSPEA